MLSRRRVLIGAAIGAAGVASAAVVVARKSARWRAPTLLVAGAPHVDGAGVALTKMLGGRALAALDPFLMLDEFHSRDPRDYQRGFPDHPHRGFETVTLMIDGAVVHKDSVGNHGRIEGGGVQWMTAGRGIVHSEMPTSSTPGGDLWGYQLWVNLPAREKWRRPRYQDLTAASFVAFARDDGEVRVLAGALDGRRGPVDGIAIDPLVVDVRVPRGGQVRLDVPAGHACFAQVVHGAVRFGDDARAVGDKTLAVLEGGTGVRVVGVDEDSRALVFAGRPIGEPIARRGPFVMNTEDELRQAFDDYRSGRLVDG